MLKPLLSLLAVLLVGSISLYGQCEGNSKDARCIEQIRQSNTFVKSYKLNYKLEQDKEFSSVLAKDTQYYLNLCEGGELSNNVVINVYNTKRKLIASNQHKNEVMKELSFACEKTGVYYFEFKANNPSGQCGIGALSFRRMSSK